MLREKRPRFIGKPFIRGTLLVLVFMLVSGVFSYAANVKYHGLGSDARRVYVKEIKDVNISKAYDSWRIKCNGDYLIGFKNLVTEEKGDVYNKKFDYLLSIEGNVVDIICDKKILLTEKFDKKNKKFSYFLYDLQLKKKIYIGKLNNVGHPVYLYDKNNLIYVKTIRKGAKLESDLLLYDLRIRKEKTLCRIMDKKANIIIHNFKFFDNNNIFFSYGNKEAKGLYRLKLYNCKQKEILKRPHILIDVLGQGYYKNYKGDIRIIVNNTIIDRNGKLINIIPEVYYKLKKLLGLKEESDRRIAIATFNGVFVSPDDKLILIRAGELDPENDEYWLKGGREGVFICDFKGRVVKLDLKGYGVPIIYWHPLGDRLFLKDNKGKLKIVVLGRR